MARYAYRNIRTPILEHTALFVRGIGEVTDIVEKEMYSFEDRSDKYGDNDHLTLRPGEHGRRRARRDRAFAALRRRQAALVHRARCSGASGRSADATASSTRSAPRRSASPGPDVDAELILLARRALEGLGPRRDVRARTQQPRASPPSARVHRAAADRATSSSTPTQLDEDAQRRLHSNPLRILDTKNPAMKDVVEAAPKLIDFLGAESLAHFERPARRSSTPTASPTRINPRLVRGLDYYNLTVFEFVTDRLGAQGTVCAGGRYDDLIVQIGGKPAPAVGWALGVERVLELLKEQGAAVPAAAPDAYAVVPDAGAMPRGAAHAASSCATPACACRCMPPRPTGWAASSRSSRRPTPAAPPSRWFSAPTNSRAAR